MNNQLLMYIKPLVDAVVKREESTDFEDLVKLLRISKSKVSKEDGPVYEFINSLSKDDVSSKDGLIRYLEKAINNNLTYTIFQVYDLVKDMNESLPQSLAEIDDFLESIYYCDDEENETYDSSLVFKTLLLMCEGTGMKIDHKKVTIENLAKLAKPIAIDIIKKSNSLDYKSDEVISIVNDINVYLGSWITQSDISENEENRPLENTRWSLWKELYDNLVGSLELYGNAVGNAFITPYGVILTNFRNALNNPKYDLIAMELRDKLAKTTNSSELIDYIFRYIGKQLEDEKYH